ncbi:hypothetical protein [Rhizobium sp. NPDC092011]
MNPEVFFWSQNPDFYLVFSHILAVEGLSSVLLDEQEVGKLAGRTSVLAIVLDTENNAEHALRLCSLIKADRATAHIPLLALVPGGDERYYLDLLQGGCHRKLCSSHLAGKDTDLFAIPYGGATFSNRRASPRQQRIRGLGAQYRGKQKAGQTRLGRDSARSYRVQASVPLASGARPRLYTAGTHRGGVAS